MDFDRFNVALLILRAARTAQDDVQVADLHGAGQLVAAGPLTDDQLRVPGDRRPPCRLIPGAGRGPWLLCLPGSLAD
jgi:hypothetical protein